MRFVRGFGRFWYDFLIGDDWRIAVAVATTLGIGALVLVLFEPREQLFTACLGVALMAAFVLVLRVGLRNKPE
jgi:hypothetical protein